MPCQLGENFKQVYITLCLEAWDQWNHGIIQHLKYLKTIYIPYHKHYWREGGDFIILIIIPMNSNEVIYRVNLSMRLD